MGYTPSTRKTNIITPQAGGSFVRKTTLEKMAENDQIAYVNHNQQLLISELRDQNISSITNDRPYQNPSTTKFSLLAIGLIFKIPDPIPGTNNLTTGTAFVPGSLTIRGLLYNAQMRARIRMINNITNVGNLNLSGLSSGATVTSSVANAWEWRSNTLSFPTGVSSGDLFQLDLMFIADPIIGLTPGFVAGYEVFEDELQSAAP